MKKLVPIIFLGILCLTVYSNADEKPNRKVAMDAGTKLEGVRINVESMTGRISGGVVQIIDSDRKVVCYTLLGNQTLTCLNYN